MKKKILLSAIVALSVALLVAVGGSIAWLIDVDSPVTNTFEPSDIDVELFETKPTTADNNNYKMIPGTVLVKDPTVTITTDINCVVFVKIEENGKSVVLDDYLSYAIADGWSLLAGEVDKDNSHAGDEIIVIYRTITTDTKVTNSYAVLKDNIVTVNTSVTKQMMNVLGSDATNYPTLAFTAYAIQTDNIVDNNSDGSIVDDAWTLASNSN